MNSLNHVTLVGRVGQDPSIKYFESGSTVCSFSIAVSKKRKDSEPNWFQLELWNKTAEVAANYVNKGSLVGIQGYLKFERWIDRNTGSERSKPVIVVNELSLLGSKGGGGGSSQYQHGNDDGYNEFAVDF